jgi:cell division protein FtsB
MFWRSLFLGILAVINIALFGRMVWGPTGLLEYRELKKQHAALEEQIAAIDRENVALSREIRLLQQDKQYMEKVIRQRLHYVRGNEILYLFDNASQVHAGAVAHERKN